MDDKEVSPVTSMGHCSACQMFLCGTTQSVKCNIHEEKVFLVCISHQSTLMFWDLRAQKQSGQSAPEQKVDLKKSSVPDTFKHLDRTWKPLFKVVQGFKTQSE